MSVRSFRDLASFPRRWLLPLLLTAAAGGCFATAREGESTAEQIEALRDDETAVVVQNDHWRPVHVYLLREGRQVADLSAPGQATRVVGVRWSLLSDGRNLFRIEVIGSSEVYATVPTVVPEGAAFHLVVQAPLRFSYSFLN